MIICIQLKSGNQHFTSAESIENVKKRAELGEPIECWWFTTEGRKNEEVFIFPDDGDAISHYRTESDASPLEEM